jgi:hypothetical protein
MMVRIMFAALIAGSLLVVSAPPTRLLAQSNAPSASAPKDAGAVSPENAMPNTNTTPTKHRYWRHRGGKHPHFGSRRVRT